VGGAYAHRNILRQISWLLNLRPWRWRHSRWSWDHWLVLLECRPRLRGVALSTCAIDHRFITNQLTASHSLLWPFMLVWLSVRHSNLFEFPQRLHLYIAKTIDSLDYRLAKTVSYGAGCYTNRGIATASRLSVRDITYPDHNRLEIFENNFTINHTGPN